jgi:hypothetical protein
MLGKNQRIVGNKARLVLHARSGALSIVAGVLMTCLVVRYAGAAMPAATPGGGATDESLELTPLTTKQQETENWCWAASAETIMQKVDHDVAQCKQATDTFVPGTPGYCCAHPEDDSCDKPAWPSFEPYGFVATQRPGPLSFDEIKKEIAINKRPFAFTWNWIQKGKVVGAHMMVVVGYRTVNGTQWVYRMDPLTGDKDWITYENYVGQPGDHSHSRDYYLVSLKPQASPVPRP